MAEILSQQQTRLVWLVEEPEGSPEPVDVNVDNDEEDSLFVTQVSPQPRDEDLEPTSAAAPSSRAAPTVGSVAPSAGASADVGLLLDEVKEDL